MSRVFEALNKATNEKKKQEARVSQSSEPVATLAASSSNGVNLLDSHVELNGKKLEQPISLPVAKNGNRSWREKLEEAVFGWDLRHYTSYPIVAIDKDSPAAEQYKILREQIKRLRAEAGIRTFAISSPVKRDGKTTVAVNLAAALALDYEEKVLLIDGDLRNPSVHRYLSLQGSPGLADFLGSNHHPAIRDLVKDTFLPSLRVLPAGRPSSFSSELLAKEKMNQAMEEIRTEFPGHQIIIDCPPVLSTPDPLVIARQVDGVLMVVRAGKTPRDYLLKALQSINSNKVLGVILNGADLGISSKYYYYSAQGSH
ncbi:MAG: CpsD/CapB family tyrosine-protein kinase [Alphaproteobacteria bacterium]